MSFMVNLRKTTVSPKKSLLRISILAAVLVSMAACAGNGGVDKYRDETMDFGSVQTIAVMPFVNLTRDQAAGERVRDVFTVALLASGGVYVIPPGEVAKGIGLTGMANPGAPSSAEIVKFAPLVKANAIITGVIREYGELRSGSATANVISLSLQMMETQTGKVVWSTSSTKGGIDIADRLFGGGGEPLNTVTKEAVEDLIDQLYE